ncbi:unnamed protein product [Arctogadus glacialis]
MRIFAVLTLMCIFLAPTTAGESCRPMEYDVSEICCPMCDKGSVVKRNCTQDSSTSCTPCERGTYMDMASGLSRCYSCRTCKAEQGLVAERECTREQDSACTVLDGFYCQEPNQESGCTLAQKHTQCNASQMTKLPGTRGTDTVCEDCKTGYYSTPGLKCTEGKSSCGNGKVLQKGSQTKETVCNTAPRRHHYDVILSVMLLLLHG